MAIERRSKLAGRAAAAAILALLFAAAGCGYHVAGRGAKLPEEWRTIAVPTMLNRTSQYRIEQRLTEAIIRELLARTKYRVVQDEAGADAVLRGEVKTIDSHPVQIDPVTGRVTLVLINIHASVVLTDRVSGKVVYKNNDILFRDEYQIATDVFSFFEEKDPALGRMAHDFAGVVVSSILENF